ncbi:uncharacterized protein [Pagrus major]|uniref:uncharacterized protein n=1 Tax=Pagrus major TaxID=143350 RepID=UPI003CC8CC51
MDGGWTEVRYGRRRQRDRQPGWDRVIEASRGAHIKNSLGAHDYLNPPLDEGSGDWQPPKNGTEEEASVKLRVPQLRKKRPTPTPRNRLSSELSSSEDEGSGDWQPPKNGTEEEDSEEEEEEDGASVKRRVPQLRKKRPAPTPRNSPEMTKKAKMAAQVPPRMKQACVRPVTAKTLVQPSQNVHRKSKLCDTTEERKTCEEEREKQQEEPSEEERKTCKEERMKLQEEPSEVERKTCEEEREKQQEEPSEEERKTCE